MKRSKLRIIALLSLCCSIWVSPAQAITSVLSDSHYNFTLSISNGMTFSKWYWEEPDPGYFGSKADAEVVNTWKTDWLTLGDGSGVNYDGNLQWEPAYAAMSPDTSGSLAYGESSKNEYNPPSIYIPNEIPPVDGEIHAMDAQSSAKAEAGGQKSAAAIAKRWATFLVDSPGTLTITATPVGDGLHVKNDSNSSTNLAYGSAQVWSNMRFNSSAGGLWLAADSSSSRIGLTSMTPGTLEKKASDEPPEIQNISYPFDTGWYGTFEFGVRTISAADDDTSPIPLPSAVWLLATALIGMAGLQRFRS